MPPTKRRSFLKKMLVGAAALATWTLESCWTPFKMKLNWTNALLLSGVDPKEILHPQSLTELTEIVKRAEAQKTSLKMVGSGHSFSDVAFCDRILLMPEKLDKELKIDRSRLKAPWQDNDLLMQVEAGISIEKLNECLDTKGLALENMGGYDAQTISGAIMTATHGSGMTFGPINSQILSMTVVGAGGQVMIVEPTDGITDPAQFDGMIQISDQEKVPAVLKQDDHYFNAILVSMGSCGVVYSLILKARERFWLKEVRTVTTWGALTGPGGFLRRLANGERIGSRPGESKYYEVYFNPYNLKDDNLANHTCLLTERFIVEAPGELSRQERKRGNQGNRALAFLGRLTRQGDDLVRFLNKHPRKVPKFVESSLKELRDVSHINKSHKVFHIGPPNEIRAYGIEMCFKISDIIAAAEACMEHAKKLQKRNWLHSAPPSIRFVDRSDAYLAMTNQQESAFIEMGILVGANGADELLKSHERMFIEKFNARPHWGLDLNILTNSDQVRDLYGASFDRWLEVYQEMNSSGVFNGRFTDRLGISVV